MKKPKVKMDSGKLKAAVVNHIEKVLFAIVFVCFVWMVYAATKVETYTRTPDELMNVSRDTQQHLDSRDFSQVAEQGEVVATFRDPVIVDGDSASEGWQQFNPAQKPAERRQKPEVFAPTEMRAHAGIGAIATVADAATMAERDLARLREEEEKAKKLAEEAERAAKQAGSAGGGQYGGYPGTGRGTGREGGGAGYPGAPPTGRGTGREGGIGRGTGREGGGYPGTGYPGMVTGAPVDEDQPEPPVIPVSPEMVLKGARWVCLTGLVPGKKQYEEFKKAAGPDYQMTEMPQYFMFEVQRAEYTPGKQPGETDWTEVDVKKALMGMKDWAAQYPEVGKMEKIIPSLAMPLPPLVTRNWGPEVVHEPQIEKLDLQAQTDQVVALTEQIEALRKQQEEDAKNGSGSANTPQPTDPMAPPADDWSTLLGQPAGGYGGGGYPGGGRGGEGGMTRAPGQTGRPPGYGPGATGRPPMGYGPGATGRPGMGYGSGAGGYGASMDLTPPDHYLLRFFDFTVESGKSYVYRVRLRMRNPNWQYPTNQLVDPSLKDDEFIYGEFSAITDAARVPGNNALVSGEAKARDRFDPQATVYIANFNPAKGIMVNVEKKVVRGQIANTNERKVEYFDSAKNELETLENVAMHTDLAVIDILGGESIGKNAAKIAPARMLLMDAEGNFEVRDELTDRTAFLSAKAAEEQVENFKKTGTAGGGVGAAGYPGPMMGPAGGRGTGRPPGYPGGGEMRGGGR